MWFTSDGENFSTVSLIHDGAFSLDSVSKAVSVSRNEGFHLFL